MSDNPVAFRWLFLGLALVAALAAPTRGFARGELRDPTRPPDASLIEDLDATTPVSSPYRLSAILVAEGRRIAVINGHPVQTGDRVSDAKVLRILRDKVVLRASTGDLTIRLLPISIKTGVGAGK